MNAPATTQTIILPINKIFPSPTNPRVRRNKEADAELAESIKKHGIIQDISVRPWPKGQLCGALQPGEDCFEVIYGHRRYDGARDAGLTEIKVVVRHLTDIEVMELQLVENRQRKDVDQLEEAIAIERLMSREKKTAEYVAAAIGMSRSHVYDRLKLLALSPAPMQALTDGQLDYSIALMIARIPGAGLQRQALEVINGGDKQGKPLSHRAAKELLQEKFTIDLVIAPWDLADKKLVAKAGDCQACPKRSGNDLVLKAEIGAENVCTDPACYAAKRVAWIDQKKKQAETQGIKVLVGDDAKKIAPYGVQYLRGDYVDLDSINHADEERRTYRKILGDTAKPDALLELQGSGSNKTPLVEIVKEDSLDKQLAKAGWKPKEYTENASKPKETDQEKAKRLKAEAAQKELRRKCDIENKFRAELYQAVRLKAGEAFAARPVFATEELTAVAINIFRVLNADLSTRTLVEMWKGKIGQPGQHFIDTVIRNMDMPALCLFLVDCGLYWEGAEIHPWDLDNADDGLNDILIGEAERLGIDHAAIRAAAESAFPPPKAARASDKTTQNQKPEAAQAPTKKQPAKPKAKANPAPAMPAKETKKPKTAQASPAEKQKTNNAPAAPSIKSKLDPAAAWPFPTATRPSQKGGAA